MLYWRRLVTDNRDHNLSYKMFTEERTQVRSRDFYTKPAVLIQIFYTVYVRYMCLIYEATRKIIVFSY